MGADALAHVLRPLAGLFPATEYPDLLVGLASPDDAAVYRRGDSEALILTADFIPPIVDDPVDYGWIAAANAMGDVFAMGGDVLLALNLAGFPEDMDLDVAAAVVTGGAEAVREAGGVVAGGHTVIDAEPKFGLAVVGTAHPDRLLRKDAARPGDVIALTQPLGTGLVTTALRAGVARATHVDEAVGWMRALTADAARLAVAAGVRAATDVTGFGLAGHGAEIGARSGVALSFKLDALPWLAGSRDYARGGQVPGGTARNQSAFEEQVDVDPAWADLVFDPQTSGGLLIFGNEATMDRLGQAMEAAGHSLWRIGWAREGRGVRFE